MAIIAFLRVWLSFYFGVYNYCQIQILIYTFNFYTTILDSNTIFLCAFEIDLMCKQKSGGGGGLWSMQGSTILRTNLL